MEKELKTLRNQINKKFDEYELLCNTLRSLVTLSRCNAIIEKTNCDWVEFESGCAKNTAFNLLILQLEKINKSEKLKNTIDTCMTIGDFEINVVSKCKQELEELIQRDLNKNYYIKDLARIENISITNQEMYNSKTSYAPEVYNTIFSEFDNCFNLGLKFIVSNAPFNLRLQAFEDILCKGNRTIANLSNYKYALSGIYSEEEITKRYNRFINEFKDFYAQKRPDGSLKYYYKKLYLFRKLTANNCNGLCDLTEQGFEFEDYSIFHDYSNLEYIFQNKKDIGCIPAINSIYKKMYEKDPFAANFNVTRLIFDSHEFERFFEIDIVYDDEILEYITSPVRHEVDCIFVKSECDFEKAKIEIENFKNLLSKLITSHIQDEAMQNKYLETLFDNIDAITCKWLDSMVNINNVKEEASIQKLEYKPANPNNDKK
ncbi:MAG: hypothetical protein J5892_05430 [Bacilli bacterium]|nr:hypothetical protein [Bacilli bacterium]